MRLCFLCLSVCLCLCVCVCSLFHHEFAYDGFTSIQFVCSTAGMGLQTRPAGIALFERAAGSAALCFKLH